MEWIDYTAMLIHRRLRHKFQMATIERHEARIMRAVERRAVWAEAIMMRKATLRAHGQT